jgi:hypothetical protein
MEELSIVQAAERALEVAESWINDQLQGTSDFEKALAELEPVRRAIARFRGA